MSFNLTRGAGKKPVYKSITILDQNQALNALLDRAPAGNQTALLESLTIGDVSINGSTNATLVKASSVIPGTASGVKALTLDSGKSVTGVNQLSLSEIYINNTLLNPSIFEGEATTISVIDSTKPQLSGVIPGIAVSGKSLILDSNKSVSGLNSLQTEAIESNSNVLVNRKNNNVAIDTTYQMNSRIFRSSLNALTNLVPVTTDTSVRLMWVCYSDTLKVQVGAFADSTIRQSADGINWSLCLTVASLDLTFITYIPSTNKVLAVAGSNLYHTSDLVTWTIVRISPYTYTCVDYSPDLQMYVAGGQSSVFWYSYDLISWFYTEGPAVTANYIKWTGKRFIAGLTGTRNLISISDDGKKWDALPITTGSMTKTEMIEWSPELNIIICVMYNNSSRTGRSIMCSKDGGLTFKPVYVGTGGASNEIRKLKWIPEIRMFIGINGTGQRYSFSPDGMNWKVIFSGSSYTYANFLFIPESRTLIFTPNSGSNYDKLVSNPAFNSLKSPLWDSGTSYISFNSSKTSASFNLGSENKNLIKFVSDNKRFMGQLTLENGILELKSRTLQLNGTNLILPQGNILKVRGLRFLEKTDFTKSVNGNVNHNGYLCADSAIVNGSAFDASSTADIFKSNPVGSATASKLMLKHTDGSISGVSSLQANSIRMNNFVFTGGNASNVDLSDIISKDGTSAGACSVFNNYTVSSTIWGTVVAGDYTFYLKEIDLLVVVRNSNSILYKSFTNYFDMSTAGIFTTAQLAGTTLTIRKVCYLRGYIYYCTSQGLFYSTSKDLLSWTQANFMSNQGSTVEDIDYSPQLDLFVATNVGGAMISKNGIDFKNIPDQRFTSHSLIYVKWVPSWNLFVGMTRSQSTSINMMIYSKNGILWDHQVYNERSVIRNTTTPADIAYSSKLDMMIVKGSGGCMYYTFNGIDWRQSHIPVATLFSEMKWIPELEIFAATTFSTSQAILTYSYDGFTWILAKPTLAVTGAAYAAFYSVEFIRSQNMLIITSRTTTGGIISIDFSNTNLQSITPDNTAVNNGMVLDLINNRVGLGITPSFSLHLSEDLAFKPSSSTWLTSSDSRLKENIQDADLEKCVENIENIPVHRFSLHGKEQLGWIAQEVEAVIPKAVKTCEMYGLKDCRALDNDQIIANLFGAVKWLVNLDEELDSEYFEI